MKHLRQYIRQILLTEAMKQPSDLPDDAYVWIRDMDNRFSVKIDAPSWPRSKADITLQKAPIGCSGAWEVRSATAASGWGPLVYDVAMEHVGNEGIMCDRTSVSREAARVWDFYLNSRSDVKAIQLDYNREPFLQHPKPNDPSDDCPGVSFTKHAHDAIESAEPDSYGHFYPVSHFQKQQKVWKDHWATKKYVKITGTPTINDLKKRNMIQFK